MRITLLGTGTSTGVPVPGCRCSVCLSDDPKNHRLRVSAYVEIPLSRMDGEDLKILIDTSTDLRQQALRTAIDRIDGVLFTHAHADHVYGFDDLRPFYFLHRQPIPIFANKPTLDRLKNIFDYAFEHDSKYQGGLLPQIDPHVVEPLLPFTLAKQQILPIPLMHGNLPILGYKIRNFAYLTDCSSVPTEAEHHLRNLEVLVLDGLRELPHPTHFNLEGALATVERLSPKRTILTHMSHDLDYRSTNEKLRSKTEHLVELGFDGMTIEIEDHQ